MKEYEVAIVAQLRKKVKVQAESRNQAIDLVASQWINGEIAVSEKDFSKQTIYTLSGYPREVEER